MNKKVIAYKLAQPDGWDFYTGRTINYRGNGHYPHIVRVPNGNASRGICTSGVGHASEKPNDCLIGASIPCSAYKLSFIPVCGDSAKWGWLEAEVLEEIQDLDSFFGWSYSEAMAPINPLLLPPVTLTEQDKNLLERWASVWVSFRDSVWNSVWGSVRDSVWDPVWYSVWGSVWHSVGHSVRDSVWHSVRDSVGDSVWDSVGASVASYIGSLFPGIRKWKYTVPTPGEYPFQPAVDLWRRGLVASFDGKIWRLHTGEKAEIVYEGKGKAQGEKWQN